MTEAPAEPGPRPGHGGKRRRGGAKQLGALLAAAFDEKTVATIDGRRRRISKREAMVAQLVDKSAAADLRAVKLLLDMLRMAEARVGSAASSPQWVLEAADEKVIDTLLLRLKLADEAPKPGANEDG